MTFSRRLGESVNGLRRHLTRSLLAMVCVAVGVATLVIMSGIGRGTRLEVTGRIDSMGTNLLTVRAAKASKQLQRERQFDEVTTLRLADAEALMQRCPELEAVSPAYIQTMRVKYGDWAARPKVVAATAEFAAVRNFTVAAGRLFDGREDRAGLRVAVIGQSLRETLFGATDPVGSVVRIGRVPFEIVGVFDTKGASRGGSDEDNMLLVPLRTALRRLLNFRHLNVIYVQVRDGRSMDEAEQSVRSVLRSRHRLDRRDLPDDFSVTNQAALLEVAQKSYRSFSFMLLSTAGVAALLGGFGILGIMLLSVRERTGEIGLRTALGATRHDIAVQFLLEALVIGVLGGLGGAAIGIVGCALSQHATVLSVSVPWDVLAGALAFSIFAGAVFGAYPARRASRLDPIDALKAE